MKYARTLKKLNSQIVAILPDDHKAILESASEMMAGEYDPSLFDDSLPVYQELGNVAIINIQGTIFPTCTKLEKTLGAVSCKEVRLAVKKARESEVENVIFNINSGGGVVQGVDETADAMRDLGKVKNTYTYCDEVMASAAYWLGSQANTVLAGKSAVVGSIGVYLSIMTNQVALENEGVEITTIQAGTHKTLGISSKTLNDEEKGYLQAGVDKTYLEFTAAISHRGLDVSNQQGEVYEGQEMEDRKLIDMFQSDFDELVMYLNNQ